MKNKRNYLLSVWFPVFASLLMTGTVKAETDPGKPLPYSQLPIEQRRKIEKAVSTPPLAERDNPYSTPMYYLFHKGFTDGFGAMSPKTKGNLLLDRNRPDWQEILIRDFAELGLTSTLFLTVPGDWDDPYRIEAIKDYFRISKKYNMKIGIRFSGDQTMGGLEASGWDLHPNNPSNKIDQYAAWAGKIAGILKGEVDHYILGDELNLGRWEENVSQDVEDTKHFEVDSDKYWTPSIYNSVFQRIVAAIRTADEDAKVSMFGMAGLDLKYIKGLWDAGYAKTANGFALNYTWKNRPEELFRFVDSIKTAQPDFKFYSNGVGYVPARDTIYYPANVDRSNALDDQAQACHVAKVMFLAFAMKMESAPYYIAVRQWILPEGGYAPHWYGFMGFMDLVVDSNNNLMTRRLPAWHAFQTIANIFYSTSKIEPAHFEIKTNEPVDFLKAYSMSGYECLIILWNNENKEQEVSITVPCSKYTYPVSIDLFNYRQFEDLSYELSKNGHLVIHKVHVSNKPQILRLVAENQLFEKQM